jgi:hypothetical protein
VWVTSNFNSYYGWRKFFYRRAASPHRTEILVVRAEGATPATVILNAVDKRSLKPTTKLFRPVGQGELDLIAASGFKAFPPRLPEQPIFYPVVHREYAEQIARAWNTKDERSGFVGYVLEFDVDGEYLGHFDIRNAGSSKHLEYWIPAEELPNFNRHICGEIRIIAKFEPRSTK